MGVEEEAKAGISSAEVARIVRQVLEEKQKTKEDKENYQELTKEVKRLGGLICDSSGKCWLATKTDIESIKNQKPKGVLGTELTLGELLKSEKSQENLAEKYMSESGLLVALKRCTGDECRILREKAREMGINIQVKGRGSMPGSSGWKDIDE